MNPLFANEEERRDVLRNVPRWHLLAETPVEYSPNGRFIHSKFVAWADLSSLEPGYVLEQVERQIMSARLPSHGFDPGIIEFRYIVPLVWFPKRVFVYAWVGGYQA